MCPPGEGGEEAPPAKREGAAREVCKLRKVLEFDEVDQLLLAGKLVLVCEGFSGDSCDGDERAER